MRTKSKERGNGPQIGVHIPIAHRSYGAPEKFRHGLRIRIEHGNVDNYHLIYEFVTVPNGYNVQCVPVC